MFKCCWREHCVEEGSFVLGEEKRVASFEAMNRTVPKKMIKSSGLWMSSREGEG